MKAILIQQPIARLPIGLARCKFRLQLFVVLVTGFLLSSCSLSDVAAKILPDAAQTQMVEIIDAVVRKDLEFIKARGSEEFTAAENLDADFEAIFEYIFSGEATETKLVDAQINFKKSLNETSVTYYTGVYERIYKEGTNIYTIILLKNKNDACCNLLNVNVKQFDVSPSEVTKFTFKDKGFKHYIVFALALITPLFIIFMLVKCVRTKGLKRKWLWVIFILVGMYGITFNWYNGDLAAAFISKTDGGVTFNFINLYVLGTSVTKTGPMAPWIFEIGFPLGAVLFWFKARKIARETIRVFDG